MKGKGHRVRLADLIKLEGVALNDFKVHCATGANPTPMDAFLDGKFKQWQEQQNNKNFECEQILSIIHDNGTKWLFAGVYEVLGVQQGKWKPGKCYLYSTKEIKGLEHLVGRVIVEFNKKFRASYLNGEKFADQLLVSSIREKRMSIGEFSGFNNVLLSRTKLCTIIRESDPSWRSPLSKIGGVYLITDTSDGKHYVGSAYGEEGIWQRWGNYVSTGDGGNKELKRLLKEKGNGHVKYFQYKLLEVCDINSNKDQIIERESHWKEVLMSREFGLNKN